MDREIGEVAFWIAVLLVSLVVLSVPALEKPDYPRPTFTRGLP